jgi:hypothetical protein
MTRQNQTITNSDAGRINVPFCGVADRLWEIRGIVALLEG